MSEQNHGASADCSSEAFLPSCCDDRTFKPYGYGQLFPSFSPRSSGAGDRDFDWTMAEEKILRDVAQWLSAADLRRARLVCKTWYGALATLTTKAATPAESLVPQWKGQLEAMLQAFPCLHELTISSRLSSVAAQQLGVLASAKQLQVLNIPQGQALQDRSLLALQALASHLRELRINGASSLSRRSLLLLSVLANLELLELKNCGKISWCELQQAWKAACMAYEAQAAAEAGGSSAGTFASSSGGGSSRFSSSGGTFGGKLGAWLPTGRLFRTSSPSSNAIQSALAWQRAGTSSLFAKIHDITRGGGGSSGSAAAVAQQGIGAVGNGRSSCGGGMPEAPARSLLWKKQKEGAAAAVCGDLAPVEEPITEVDASLPSSSSSCLPVRSGLLRLRAKPAVTADEDSPRPISMLSKVGSLVWHSSSTASAGAASNSSSSSLISGTGSSLAAQASCVQAALLAVLSQAEAADAANDTELLPAATSPRHNSSGAKAADAAAGGPDAQPALTSSSTAGLLPSEPGSSSQPQYKPRRRTTGDRVLPAMPFTKLASLSFTCSEVMLRSPNAELAAVAALTSLSSLEISKCKLPDAVFVHLQSLSRLSKLKLTGLWSMGDAGLQQVAQLTSLKSLALSEAMHVTAQGLQALSSLTGLTSLALGFTQDLGPGSLARVVNSLPCLQCVEVAAPSWGDQDCELLAEAAPPPAPAAARQAGSERGSGSAAADTGAGEAAAAGGSGGAAAPQMFWDLAGASFCRASSSSSRPASRTNSSRQLLAPAARLNSSWSMRAGSFSSLRSHSFGSFSFAAGLHVAPPAPLPNQPLLVLRLHGCRFLTSRGMAALKQLPELHALVLEDCKEVCAAEAISQGLLPPKLTSLTLRSMPFGNIFSSCVSMPACATRLAKLELVALEGAHDGQVRRLLSFFPNIAELNLSGCSEIGDAAMQHLALLPRLRQLSLAGCGVVGEGLEHLTALQRLRMLCMKGCSHLGDAGLWQLWRLPALQELDVSECAGVSEQGLLCVAQGAPHLVRLDVTGCKAVSRVLLSACPHYLSVRHSLV